MGHGLANSDDAAADAEKRVRDEEERLASVDVAQFPVDGLHGGGGEAEGGEKPAGVVEGVEFGGDDGVDGEEEGGVGVGDEDADEEDEDDGEDGGGGRGAWREGFFVGRFGGGTG